MKIEKAVRSVALVVLSLSALVAPAAAQDPAVPVPKPGVPEIFTLEGAYVRAAYNNEGYAILGYRTANNSIGEEWMLLDFGVTVRSKTPDYDLTRGALSLDTPDGKTIPLPSIEEYRQGSTQALQARARIQRDSINYFPPEANRACALTFFPDLDQRAMPRDEAELSSNRACLGRLYFKVPGGITYGQHYLNVKFEKSVVRVPFRILTKEEEEYLSKNFKSIQKQVEDAFKPKQD